MNSVKLENSKFNIGSFLVKCSIYCFIAISILLFAYTFYRSEVIYNGANREKYALYFNLSTISIILWSLVLYLDKLKRLYILIITFSLLFGLYCAELSIFFLGVNSEVDNSDRLKIAIKRGIDFDERNKLQYLKSLRDNDIEAFLTLGAFGIKNNEGLDSSKGNKLFPLGGVSNKLTVLCNENGQYAAYLSDRYGFNNKDLLWDYGVTEWLLLGDSFTLGECVNPSKNIAGQLDLMTEESVINLGGAGNGPLSELATLKEYGSLLRPKRVLWFYFEGNDLRGDLKVEKSIPILTQYLKSGFSQQLAYRQKDIDKGLSEILEREINIKNEIKNEEFNIRSILLLPRVRTIMGFEKIKVNIDPLFVEILKEAKNHVEQIKGDLYFVYIPEYSRYSSEIKNNSSYRKRQEILNILDSLQIPVIDLHKEVFENLDDPLSLFPFGINGHFNERGYMTITRAIINEIN
jgi:hypothetical protein